MSTTHGSISIGNMRLMDVQAKVMVGIQGFQELCLLFSCPLVLLLSRTQCLLSDLP